MFARKALFSSIGRTTALATVAALALTAVEPSLAVAGPAKRTGLTAATGTSDATDFSARRYYRGGYYRGGGAAAAAAFAGIVGTGLAIAAANNRYYDDSYAYYGGPGYYGGGPVYYGGPTYYYGGGSSYGYGGYGYKGQGSYYGGQPYYGW
jgi:hypothetical protein